MAFSWVAVEAQTGTVIAELPLFSVDSVKLTLGKYETVTGSMPITGSTQVPENWLYALEPFSAAFLLLSDDSGTNQPVWGGYIAQRIRTHGDTASVPLITAEGYLDRRYVGDVTYTNVDQNTICTSLISGYVSAGKGTLPGMPFTSSVVGAAGTVRTRAYLDSDDQTVYARLTELMSVRGGPEWTVTWQHLTSPERYLPIFNVGSMIGVTPSAGLTPSARFELGAGGSVTQVTYTEDYTSGQGANYVTATGTQAADGTRQVGVASLASSTRRPTIEYRWNPSTSITDAATLLLHAQQALPLMQSGSRSLALSSINSSGPRLGVDWGLGDYVAYQIGGPDQFGMDTVPAFPGGLSGTARVLGWELAPDVHPVIVTPTLGGV